MRKFTALLLAALVLVGANIALADKTITLDKDTKLVPQGWTVADDIKFKKNTVVKLNDDGQVNRGRAGECHLSASCRMEEPGEQLLLCGAECAVLPAALLLPSVPPGAGDSCRRSCALHGQ